MGTCPLTGTARHQDPRRRSAQRVEVGLVAGDVDHLRAQQPVVPAAVVLGRETEVARIRSVIWKVGRSRSPDGLPERLKAPALLLALDAIWRQLEGPLRRRCVLVDEAWLLMREPSGARFLHRLAKSARKRWCGLTAITQGRRRPARIGARPRCRQQCRHADASAPGAAGDRACRRGLPTHPRRAPLPCSPAPPAADCSCRATSGSAQRRPSAEEHALVTTDPAFLLTLDDSGANPGVGSR
jgi:hypothetical protein